MALYSYEAFTRAGKRVTGSIDAPSLAHAREQLMQQNVYPITLTSTSKDQPSFLRRLFGRSVSIKDKILFTKQLTVLLRSGVPLLESITLLIEQFKGRFRFILIAIRDSVKEGSSLAGALALYPTIFDTVYIQLVKAGEASGDLEPVLNQLTLYLERRETISKKIKGALQYPLIQLVVIIGAVVLLVTQVVPQISEVLLSQGLKLPFTTRTLIGLSDFIIHHYVVLPAGIALTCLSFLYWKRTQSGKIMLDRLILKIPLISYIARTNAVVQFSYTLGVLLHGGVNLADALDIVATVVDNQILAQTLLAARDKIIKEGKIADYLQQTHIFPPVAIYLIRTGEQSGNLDEMLLHVARNNETELSELIDSLTTFINPIMLIVMAVTIGFIVFSIIGPIQEMGRNIVK